MSRLTKSEVMMNLADIGQQSTLWKEAISYVPLRVESVGQLRTDRLRLPWRAAFHTPWWNTRSWPSWQTCTSAPITVGSGPPCHTETGGHGPLCEEGVQDRPQRGLRVAEIDTLEGLLHVRCRAMR
jgi:hypothetical protein